MSERGEIEIASKGGTVKQRIYLDGSPYTASAVIETGNPKQQIFYIHRDYLGSITQISNNIGNLAAEYSYDAWGRMRNETNWQVYAPGTEPSLKFGRGYTGHEHLQNFGLINMNARLYDPVLGRFLAPDRLIGALDFTQDYNRYMYARNNPMYYIDQSGEMPVWLIGLIGFAIYTGISYLASVRDNGYKDWTPRPNYLGLSYSTSSGLYSGISFDNGAHISNVGYGKQGWTMGNTNNGQTTMTPLFTIAMPPGQKVAMIEQQMRSMHNIMRGLDYEWNKILDYSMWVLNTTSATAYGAAEFRYMEFPRGGGGMFRAKNSGRWWEFDEFGEILNAKPGTGGMIKRGLETQKAATSTLRSVGNWTGKFGTYLGGANLAYEAYLTYNGEMSPYRFTYHAVGFTATEIATRTTGVGGLIVGAGFMGGELMYDRIFVPFMDWTYSIEDYIRQNPANFYRLFGCPYY